MSRFLPCSRAAHLCRPPLTISNSAIVHADQGTRGRGEVVIGQNCVWFYLVAQHGLETFSLHSPLWNRRKYPHDVEYDHLQSGLKKVVLRSQSLCSWWKHLEFAQVFAFLVLIRSRFLCVCVCEPVKRGNIIRDCDHHVDSGTWSDSNFDLNKKLQIKYFFRCLMCSKSWRLLT